MAFNDVNTRVKNLWDNKNVIAEMKLHCNKKFDHHAKMSLRNKAFENNVENRARGEKHHFLLFL